MQVFAVTEAVAQQSSGGGIGGFLPLILIVALVFFFMSTQRRRQRAQQQTLASLVPGTLVITTAGLYATVVEVDDGDVLLEVAPDIVCRFARGAVARVVSTPDVETSDHDGHDHDGHDHDGHDHDHDGHDHDGHDHDHDGHDHDHGDHDAAAEHPAGDTGSIGQGPDEPHVDITKKVDLARKNEDGSDPGKPGRSDEPGGSTPGSQATG